MAGSFTCPSGLQKGFAFFFCARAFIDEWI